jgi:cell wall-associated NlpC family hydrolase
MLKKALSFISAGLILFSQAEAGPKKYQFFENDYYNSISSKYAKQEYKAFMVDDGLPTPKVQNEIVELAIGFLGIKYRFGGETDLGIDCSAFVQKVYALAGIHLPRTARQQAKYGLLVSKEDLQPGDLLFFQTYARFPSHVGIYIGEGKMIHASSRGGRVEIISINKPYYVKRFLFAKRIFLYDPEKLSKVLNKKEPSNF